MMKTIGRLAQTVALLFGAGLLLVSPLSAGQPGSTPVLEGLYELVDVRNSNLVEATPADPGLDGIALGYRIQFGDTLTWLAGESCTEWVLERRNESTIDIDDDMLSDTQVTAQRLGADLTDLRRNEPLVLYCGLSAKAPVIVVDERVLVTTSRTQQSYLIFEKVADTEFAGAVQRALVSMKFFESEPGDIMDAPTRRALAFFAGYLGAPYTFNATPVTENILVALGLDALTTAATPGQWTDDQIVAEMQRFRFTEPAPATGNTDVVVSGFLGADHADRTLESLRAYLAGLPNLAYSALADKLKIEPVQRITDPACASETRCMAPGYVVAMAQVGPPGADEVCALLRSNGWFCAQR